ncbi:DUF4150 domain-containing protein [Pseudoalteromonas sp. NEC-BIFX-2020_015]|uniref:DUF4150 domain-containing protein n=1 Tax=Pseudoalteromonas sp. NEC-BIFX-2020_015 TaxID=2729544 RepID=UPI0014616F95|nr:DUF4150 domain-containing protein [Pseudoalteromonas sp. NEC-BIFX-2020_015]NMR26335.1 DUF4150 domain-containing protein [Pseudoalteromonas sp. NEC-BIFX-2020_015]
MPYINAAAGKQTGSVQYDTDALTADVRTGGSVTWRHNNPTLIGLNNSARSNNALGKANGIAIFEDKANGEAAFLAEIARPKYREKTLGEMVSIFIPDYIIPPPQWDSQKNEPVLPWNEPQSNMDVNKPISNAQDFLDLVSTHLGWEQGNQEQLTKDTQSQAAQVATVSGQNVLINGRTAVHQDSGGKLMTIDVCLTTVGPSVIPIPYPNKAQVSDITDVSSSVKVNGNGAANVKSTFTQSSGDTPGDKKGIISSDNDGEAEFILGSFNVLIEGKPAVRQGDLMISNSKNTPPMALMQSGGPAPRGLSVQVRDLDTQSEDPAQAAFIVETNANNNLIGQGKFTVTQGAFNNNQVFDEGV